jgi:hypothetical protein
VGGESIAWRLLETGKCISGRCLSLRQESGSNPARHPGLEGNHIESAGRPATLTEATHQVELGCADQSTLLDRSDAGCSASETGISSSPNLDKNPFRAVSHDQIEFTAAKPHIAFNGLQAMCLEKGPCAVLGIKTLRLAGGRHRVKKLDRLILPLDRNRTAFSSSQPVP